MPKKPQPPNEEEFIKAMQNAIRGTGTPDSLHGEGPKPR